MKIYYKLFLLSLIFFFSGCDDLLQEKPRSVISPEQFFNTDAEAITAVNGVYSRFSTTFMYQWDFGYWSDLGTDLARPTGGRESTFPFHTYLMSPANLPNTANADHWRNLYRTVGDANLVISRVSDNSKISEPIRKRVVGEAKFLRAYCYYWLTCIWGDVPMWLNELNVDEIGGAIERTPVGSVRDQMIIDLKESAEGLPVVYPAAERGRVTKWAAKILLCKYYLWQKDWQNARDVANDIITNSPHRLQPEFKDIFGIANEYNPENIWELDFTLTTHPSIKTDRFVPRQIDEPVIAGYNFTGFGLTTSAKEFVDSFHPNDKRKPLYSWNGANGITTKFWYITKFIQWNEPRGNSGLNVLIFRLADAYLMYAEAENQINGPSSSAYARINAIRSRAGVPVLENLSKDQFQNAIMNERKWELAFEYHRRWDLIRWGKLEEAVKSLSGTNPEGAQNIKPHHVLAPIPPEEIIKNPALTQNPGY